MDIISSLNNDAFNFANSIASPLLNTVMSYWAESFYVVLLALLAYLYIKKSDNTFPFVFALVVMFAISEIIKDIVREPRPCSLSNYSWINSVSCESGYGFPSSHATSLTGLAFFLKNYRYVRAAYVIWLVVILFGRVYLGDHYLTDVIAGAVVSIVVGYVIYRYRDSINRAADRFIGIFVHKSSGAVIGNN